MDIKEYAHSAYNDIQKMLNSTYWEIERCKLKLALHYPDSNTALNINDFCTNEESVLSPDYKSLYNNLMDIVKQTQDEVITAQTNRQEAINISNELRTELNKYIKKHRRLGMCLGYITGIALVFIIRWLFFR